PSARGSGPSRDGRSTSRPSRAGPRSRSGPRARRSPSARAFFDRGRRFDAARGRFSLAGRGFGGGFLRLAFFGCGRRGFRGGPAPFPLFFLLGFLLRLFLLLCLASVLFLRLLFFFAVG